MNHTFVGALSILLVSLTPLSAVSAEPNFEVLKALSAHNSGDYQTAMREALPLAQSGNRVAQWLVGAMYLDGQGVPENDAEAVKWFRECSGSSFDCELSLGNCYAGGFGVPLDYGQASWWYRKAAEQVDPSGRSLAQSALGGLYERGGHGIGQDNVMAYMWYHLAYGADTPRVNNTNNRNMIDSRLEPKMTPVQIAQGKSLVRKCQLQNFRDCGNLTVDTNSSADLSGSQGSPKK